MKNEEIRYQVVIKNILSGNSPDVVLNLLAHLFKTNSSRFNSLIEGKGLIVAKNVDLKKATKYKLSIEKTGCRVSIQTLKKTNEALKNDIKTTQCPKCGVKQPFTDECIHCGVIIQKYLVNQQKQKDGERDKISAKPIDFKKEQFVIPSSTFMPILKSYMKIINHKTIFINPNIPAVKLNRMHSHFAPFSSAEKPLVLYDSSLLQSCTTGVLLTDQRLYGKGMFEKPFRYPWSKNNQIAYNSSGHLTINSKIIIPSAPSEVPYLLSEMIRDLCEEDRVLIKNNLKTIVPQRCCACASKESIQNVEILKEARKIPPKSTGSKILGFAVDSFMLNLSPFAYMMKQMVVGGSESKQNNLDHADPLFLPFCPQCMPFDTETKTPLKKIKIPIGETINVGLVKIKPEELWFELSLCDSKFALELKKANLNTVHKKMFYIISENQNAQDIGEFHISRTANSNEEIITNLFQVLAPRIFYSVPPNIPDKKLKKAKQLIAKLNRNEKIIGLELGSQKIFTTQGIFWKFKGNFDHISYKDIQIKDIKIVSGSSPFKYIVQINSKITSPFQFTQWAEHPDWLVMFLKKSCLLQKKTL